MTDHASTQNNRWQEIGTIWKQYSGLYAFAGFLLGFVTYPALQAVGFSLGQFIISIAPEIVGIFITVVIIDTFYRRREEERLKHDLIREMGSFANPVAIRAVEALRDKGWLTDGTLIHKKFHQAELKYADLSNAVLNRCRFAGANWQNVKAYHLQLTGGQLGGIDLRKSQLNVSNLAHTNINDADAREADFRGCNLEGVHFDQTDLENCNFTGTNLKGTDFYNANLKGVDFERAVFDENTLMPDGYSWTPELDIRRYTDPEQPDFWQPTDDSWLRYKDDTPAPWWLRDKERYDYYS